MAMPKKIIKKIRARVEPKIKGLSPKRMIARVNGKKVIANSIPKGGTHLLIQCLMNFPDISYSGYHYTTGRTNSESLNTIFLKTKKGFFFCCTLMVV
jgi:hypothetical protein